MKIKEGNQEERIERKTKIDKIWIFKTAAFQFERLYIAFGDKNQSQVHGVVTSVKNIHKTIFIQFLYQILFRINKKNIKIKSYDII